jgi:hypothetical protein
MKVLLDENIPESLKGDLPGHEVSTAGDKHWTGREDGNLLQLMIAEGFDVLVTFDKGLQYQQNFRKYPIAVIVLVAVKNRYPFLVNLIPELKKLLRRPLKPGVHHIFEP